MKSFLKLTPALLCVFLLSSCIEQKILLKGNKLYTAEESTPGSAYKLTEHKLKKAQKVYLTDKTEYLAVRFSDSNASDNMEATGSCTTSVDRSYQTQILSNANGTKKARYFYPGDFSGYDCSGDVPQVKKLRYLDSKFLLQALSIPLKIRPQVDKNKYQDTFAMQAEGSVNLAIAAGWKFNYNTYSGKQNILGSRYNRYSFSPGVFMGTSVVGLKKVNTRPEIKFEKSLPAFTTGFFAMLGFNSLNLGLAVGWDIAIGKKGDTWVYHRKPWYGIALGIDLIK